MLISSSKDTWQKSRMQSRQVRWKWSHKWASQKQRSYWCSHGHFWICPQTAKRWRPIQQGCRRQRGDRDKVSCLCARQNRSLCCWSRLDMYAAITMFMKHSAAFTISHFCTLSQPPATSSLSCCSTCSAKTAHRGQVQPKRHWQVEADRAACYIAHLCSRYAAQLAWQTNHFSDTIANTLA